MKAATVVQVCGTFFKFCGMFYLLVIAPLLLSVPEHCEFRQSAQMKQPKNFFVKLLLILARPKRASR